MTDPIKAAEAEVKAVEADVSAEDKAIADAVREMYLHALLTFEAELAAAHAAEQRAAAWIKAKRYALLGIGIGILLIVIAHLV